MKRGEKVYSFVKYEKDMESGYRRGLEEIKRPEEIGGLFREYVFKLLKKIKPDLPEDMKEGIVFKPDDGEPFDLSDELRKAIGDELMEKSDLPAIIRRFALSAQHRYKKLKSDDERTDLFRLGDGARPH